MHSYKLNTIPLWGGIPLIRIYGAVGLLLIVGAGLAAGTDNRAMQLVSIIPGVAGVVLLCWLRRSLPPRSGTFQVKGLLAPVEVQRDERGVPHITATNLRDLYFAQGYVTAQDRLWSMDLHRRAASGHLAEIFGPSLLAHDKHLRTVGIRRAAEESHAAYDPATLAFLEAYAAGVNARIGEGRLPPEFSVLGYGPAPWSAVDSLSLGNYLSYQLGSTWPGDLVRAEVVQTVGARKAAELFWDPPDAVWLEQLETFPLPDLSELHRAASALLTDSAGGSAWAMAGTRTRSGSALLAADMHLPVWNPSLWYQAHLLGPDHMDVAGATLPGIPGVIVGQARAFAWTAVPLRAHVQQLVVHQVNPGNPAEYEFEGTWHGLSRRSEPIWVKGQSAPVLFDVEICRHGPVLARGTGTVLALQWTGLSPCTDLQAMLELNRSSSWPEFCAALEGYDGPVQDFVYAGRDGTVARKVAGRVPVLNGSAGAPVPGWLARHEWSAVVPSGRLPVCVNPQDGLVIAGSSVQIQGDRLGSLAAAGGPPHQARRLWERLSSAREATPEKAIVVLQDSTNVQARTMLQTLLGAVQEGLRQGLLPENLNEIERKALLLLSGWDCDEEPGSAAAAFWHQWHFFLIEAIFRPQMGLALFDQFVSSGLAEPLLDRLLLHVAEGGDSHWLGREGEDGLNRVVLRSFRRAVSLVAAKHGLNPDRWRWDRDHRVRFCHPLICHSRVVRFLLNLPSYPVGGSSGTIARQGYSHLSPFGVRIAASYRQVVDLDNASPSLEICAPGQSGHPLSPHFGDQILPWLKGDLLARLLKPDSIRPLPVLRLSPRDRE